MWYSFLLYVHKVQVIPDLTGNDPDGPEKKTKQKHKKQTKQKKQTKTILKKKKRTEPILYKIKKRFFGPLNHNNIFRPLRT